MGSQRIMLHENDSQDDLIPLPPHASVARMRKVMVQIYARTDATNCLISQGVRLGSTVHGVRHGVTKIGRKLATGEKIALGVIDENTGIIRRPCHVAVSSKADYMQIQLVNGRPRVAVVMRDISTVQSYEPVYLPMRESEDDKIFVVRGIYIRNPSLVVDQPVGTEAFVTMDPRESRRIVPGKSGTGVFDYRGNILGLLVGSVRSGFEGLPENEVVHHFISIRP